MELLERTGKELLGEYGGVLETALEGAKKLDQLRKNGKLNKNEVMAAIKEQIYSKLEEFLCKPHVFKFPVKDLFQEGSGIDADVELTLSVSH